MNEFQGMRIGDFIEVFSNRGSRVIPGSETRSNGITTMRSQKVFFRKPTHAGKIAAIRGHNKHACKITFEDGKSVEIGLTSHIHREGKSQGKRCPSLHE